MLQSCSVCCSSPHRYCHLQSLLSPSFTHNVVIVDAFCLSQVFDDALSPYGLASLLSFSHQRAILFHFHFHLITFILPTCSPLSRSPPLSILPQSTQKLKQFSLSKIGDPLTPLPQLSHFPRMQPCPYPLMLLERLHDV